MEREAVREDLSTVRESDSQPFTSLSITVTGLGLAQMECILVSCLCSDFTIDFISLFCVKFLMKKKKLSGEALHFHHTYIMISQPSHGQQVGKPCKFKLFCVLARLDFLFTIIREMPFLLPSLLCN